jgi:phosphatidylethanolamine-binding protein (PEBP) family uncharacterized protein
MRRRGAALAVAVVVTALGAAACAEGDGRDITSPAPGATAPTTTDPAKIDGGSTLPLLVLTSPVLVDGQPMPPPYTCDGAGTAPVLSWANVPTAAELALVLMDETAGLVHWVVSGIPVGAGQYDPAAPPAGSVDLGYSPPCPPAGEPAHRFAFTLYAVTSPLGIVPTMDVGEAVSLIQASPAQIAQLVVTYER